MFNPFQRRPANFGKTDQANALLYLPSLLVAGAFSAENEVSHYKGVTSGVPNIYVPGFLNVIADGAPATTDEGFETSISGTSNGAWFGVAQSRDTRFQV